MHLFATCMQMLSVIFVFVRVVDGCRTKNILSSREVAAVKCVFLTFWSVLVLTFGLGIQFIFLVGAFLFIPLYVLLCQRRRRQQLRKEVYELLQTLILRLGAGESLPSAILTVKKSGSGDLRKFLAEEPTLFKDRRLQKARQELFEIHKYLHQAILRLRWLREAWETEDRFEQKRMRVTSMIRAQVGLLAFLYSGLLLFTVNKYEYIAIRKYLNLSLFLFVIGVIALVVLGRSFRWKV